MQMFGDVPFYFIKSKGQMLKESKVERNTTYHQP